MIDRCKHMPKKIGRNDPCSCGSGKKYKHCCLQLDRSEIGSTKLIDMLPKFSGHNAPKIKTFLKKLM